MCKSMLLFYLHFLFMDTNPGWGGRGGGVVTVLVVYSNIKKMSTNEEPHEQQDKRLKRNL